MIYQVTNLADSGPGSLREAILNANRHAKSFIEFSIKGTIILSRPLPPITTQVIIDGSTSPSYTDKPIICINFSYMPGLILAKGSDRSVIKSLSLIHSSDAAITLYASEIVITGNYIGLDIDGNVAENYGDGIKITASSHKNLIGNINPVLSQTYYSSASNFNKPVSLWQGIIQLKSTDPSKKPMYMICGSSGDNGLLYVGTLDGTTGKNFLLKHPDAVSTIALGLNQTTKTDSQGNSIFAVVGNYKVCKDKTDTNHSFLWTGTLEDLPYGGNWQTINYPQATYQSAQWTTEQLTVGNAYIPSSRKKSKGRMIGYIYDQNSTHASVKNIIYPHAKSTRAYGIWHNEGHKYTICGGYSNIEGAHDLNHNLPLPNEKAFLVDFNLLTRKFSNWKTFTYRNDHFNHNIATNFKGISSAQKGIYTLSANSIFNTDPNKTQGSWVTIRRNSDGSFGEAFWVDILGQNPQSNITNAGVYNNHLVGTDFSKGHPTPYQSTINFKFQLSNVISGNLGNGIQISGSKGNLIAMNYIGSDSRGSQNTRFGNKKNGILINSKSSYNIIGGQFVSDNNPTGSEGSEKPIFIRPPQGNLISGNGENGVLIKESSSHNLLSGNYIGTDKDGLLPIGNQLNGVKIENSPHNSLIGCTVYENPFVFYNVISGNLGDGIHLKNANNTTIQGNFIGINATNNGVLPNNHNGLKVTGTSKNTTVGGVIPLGNVISGNRQNGIFVTDKASYFTSFNTFGGLFAFGDAAPNGRNGILITSTGKQILLRTNIFSGNNWNGIEISGNASLVQVTDTDCGLSSNMQSAIPNQHHGILVGGKAHHTIIGGSQASIEMKNRFSGNLGYGIYITDQAHHTYIFTSDIGTSKIGNGKGGILLDSNTFSTDIKGREALSNNIEFNNGPGICILGAKKTNILYVDISNNTKAGIFATGDCKKTVIRKTTLQDNGYNGSHNIDINNAIGIHYIPYTDSGKESL